jgi:hypothetical protein
MSYVAGPMWLDLTTNPVNDRTNIHQKFTGIHESRLEQVIHIWDLLSLYFAFLVILYFLLTMTKNSAQNNSAHFYAVFRKDLSSHD